jgi:hypothetical protein
LSCANREPLRALWKAANRQLSLAPDVELAVDVDPINLR